MTIATKNGSVIIKDGSVAQNCGCCRSLICGCNLSGVTVPESFLLSTSDITFYFVSQTGSRDMSGVAPLLSILASNRQVSASINQMLSSRDNRVVYTTPLSSGECFAASAELVLSCSRKIVSGVLNFGVGRFCQDASLNGGAGCALTAFFSLSDSALDYCQNPQPSSPINYSNFYNSERAVGNWRCDFIGPNPSQRGFYFVSSGEVSITPVYANPLP